MMKFFIYKLQISSTNIFLAAIVFYFIFFTFYDLNWGAPYYFHPDERNIASSISQLKFPDNLSPNFFAYGQLPIYIVYFIGIIINFIINKFVFSPIVNFEQAIILGRLISASLSVGLVFLTYRLAREIGGKIAALITTVLSCTSVAFFQFSHYGTFEIWLSFFSVLASILFINYIKEKKTIYFACGTAILGMLTALKLSSIVLIIIPLGLIIYELIYTKSSRKKIVVGLKLFFLFIYMFVVFYIISAPFNIFDPKAFFDSMKYEREVATGTLNVFYTGSFFDKLPIIFQYEKILPFLINPILTIISIPSFIYCLYTAIKKKNLYIGVILVFFLTLFISSSILYAKWTRYIVPSLPFLYIMIALLIDRFIKKTDKQFSISIIAILAVVGILFSFSYIKTTRIDTDTRIQLRNFVKQNIPKDSRIISEVYDMGIVPINELSSNIVLFNFYDLDSDPAKESELPEALDKADYIILPSQRILKPRILDPKHFPKGHKFYMQLFDGTLGFEKIYESPCDVFCKLTYFGNPVFNLEETTNVFDRPTGYVFKKNEN